MILFSSISLLLLRVLRSGFMYTVGGFIFLGTNCRRLSKNHTFVGSKIHGHSIFFHNSYSKSLFRGYLISWIGPSIKTTKIRTPRKLCHPKYCFVQTELPYCTKTVFILIALKHYSDISAISLLGSRR